MRYKEQTLSILFLPSARQSDDLMWHPRSDIYRSDRGWLIKLDLAGVRREDIIVESHGSRIAVRGHRRDRLARQKWSHYSMEIAYGSFERVFELPCSLEQASVEAELSDGMLLIHVNMQGAEEGAER